MNGARRMDLLAELVMALLGLLLILLAATRRFGMPAGLGLRIALGAVLVLWGGRVWFRNTRYRGAAATLIQRLRGASLALAGATLLAMIWMPLGRAQLMLMLVGGILALRGLACAALAASASPAASKSPAMRS
ncbi:MAG TPA: hypothetical protein VGS20_16780 [Candidatus Acidoferrales bacterium]|nr:hypothetical protein [Candidatus Acidoferrales bacterium]